MRLGDVVGRLDTLLIGATGPDRGVALASTWRGWPVAITAHLFHLRDDRGIELRAEHEYHAPSFTTVLAAGGSSLRKFGSAAITLRQRDANEVFRATADSDRHWRASAGLSIGRSDSRFSLEAEAGRRLTIGGFASSVVPESLRVERVDEPALPPDFAFAERFRSARIAYSFGAASLFWQRFDAGGKFDVRGVEIAASLPPLPIVKTAGVDFTVGVAKAGDLRGVKGWFAIRWRP